MYFICRFVYEENQHDYYPLNLGISQSDVLREKRLKILSKLNIDNIVFRLKRDAPPIDGYLLAFLRVFNMNEGMILEENPSKQCFQSNNVLN